ncbi:DUF397 domain-containing protein [Streptomyces sp. B-S-A8]|uniref:DUF397 domain-containing protein n=1 Tax=Streptomyces solicavernae TaxID=3043614 RepID=A0ABT6RUX0_9ACTN|nr:DUF397 domain-containing protein [Streptomyces sp. B-S-A8]MDI3388228.1 DUF397 domain-containing protein [Streptomyces sp. B-S-A8]
MTAESINWQKSSYSEGGEGGQCIELAVADRGILIRESDEPDRTVATSSEKLRAFVLGVKAGEFDHLI